MEKQLKSKLKKYISILMLGFIILFVFRLLYGYSLKPTNHSGYLQNTQFLESVSSLRSNIASKKYKSQSSVNNSAAVKVDQKYEKIAEINTKSTQFEVEEKLTRTYIENYNSLIQFEQKTGNKGYRKLHLLIGVPPENFDSLYTRLSAIGKVQAKQITKKDKTNEYNELNAKKSSLSKIRQSLLDLKSKGGKIEEFINLENRILDIEQQLQDLGVSLGNFDNENEFCTVKFSMFEGKEVTISLLHRIKVALEWTVKTYLAIMTMLFFLSSFVYISILILEKVKKYMT